MLLIFCPYCKINVDETELVPGGEAHIKRKTTGSNDDEFYSYLFEKKNPKGIHFEKWRHAFGCGKWFHVARCTVTMDIYGTYPSNMISPPKKIIKKIISNQLTKRELK